MVAVISSNKNANAVKRAENFGVPAYVVDPELFPTSTSHSMAVANKLKDMDINLVILAGYSVDLGVISYQYKNRIIGTYPSLIPSFEVEDGNIFLAALNRGLKITGATSYVADSDGCVGAIISQQAIRIEDGDTPDTLALRICTEAECKLLPEAVKLYCSGHLGIQGNRIVYR